MPRFPTVAPVPAESVSSFPGLYSTDNISISGTSRHADIISALPCSKVLNLLNASDSRITDEANVVLVKQKPKSDHFLLMMRRGNSTAFADLRGSTSCAGSVDLVTTQRVTAKGLVKASGRSLEYAYPAGCYRNADGTVTVTTRYEEPGDFWATLQFETPPSVGMYKIYSHEVGSDFATVGRSPLNLVEYWREVAKLQTQIQNGKTPTVTTMSGYVEYPLDPSSNFSGTITVRSDKPLSGEISLSGLQNEDKQQSLKAAFTCTGIDEGATGNQPPPKVTARKLEMNMTLDSTLNAKLGSSDLSSSSHTVWQGKLDSITSRRYEGVIEGMGNGKYHGFEVGKDGTIHNCTGTWKGKQQFHVVGTVSGSKLTLAFYPLGNPKLTFPRPCDVESHKGDTKFPDFSEHANVELKWPPSKSQKVVDKYKQVSKDVWFVKIRRQ